jgi:hypothetical protein
MLGRVSRIRISSCEPYARCDDQRAHPRLLRGLACHVSQAGSHCDQNSNGVIDIAGDLPISRVAVGVTSLHLVSGQFTAVTDSSGLVAPVNLPGGLTVVVPSGGSYTADIRRLPGRPGRPRASREALHRWPSRG